MKRRFVVLDRDGTLIQERVYLSEPSAVELIPGAGQALHKLAHMGLGLVVVTNQSGIGRQYFDEARLRLIHDRMEQLLRAQGVHLDGIYHCPHVPEDNCNCRKPKPGLLHKAAAELGFDPSETFVIGDKASDIELGCSAGAITVLVRTGYGSEVAAKGSSAADYTIDGIWDVHRLIARIIHGNALART